MVHHPKDLFIALALATAMLLIVGVGMYIADYVLYREAIAYGCLLLALTIGWFVHFHADITMPDQTNE